MTTSSRKIVIPTVSVEATETLKIVIPPSKLTREESMAALSGLISSLAKKPRTQKETVEIVYNLLQIGVPEIRAVTTTFQSVKVVQLSPTREQYLRWAGVLDDTEGESMDELPALPAAVKEEALAVTSEGAVYIALASLLFCLGRQASESSKASVLDNRPDALIRRFSLAEEEQILLPGRSAGPTLEFLEDVYNAFANYTELRKAVVLLFLGLRESAAHLPIHLEIMMTNFNLMRGAGMTHVEAILKLIRMHPWVLSVPELEPCFHRFEQDLVRFGSLDEAIRPYHRLLVPQSEYLFVSSELRPAIAVAGSFIEEVEKTFGGYVYNREVYKDLIEKVRSYVPGYHPTSQMTTLAALLGVKETPLPRPKTATEVPTEATV